MIRTFPCGEERAIKLAFIYLSTRRLFCHMFDTVARNSEAFVVLAGFSTVFDRRSNELVVVGTSQKCGNIWNEVQSVRNFFSLISFRTESVVFRMHNVFIGWKKKYHQYFVWLESGASMETKELFISNNWGWTKAVCDTNICCFVSFLWQCLKKK